MAFCLKGKLRWSSFLLLAVIVILPMTLNETKISLLLIPFALIFPAVIASQRSWEKLKMFFLYTGIAFLALLVFIKVYDHLMITQGMEHRSLIRFFEKGHVEEYLYRGENKRNPGVDEQIGRFDSIELIFKHISDEGKLIAGVGAGNASPSFFSNMQGAYYRKFSDPNPNMTYISLISAEFGLTGLTFNVIILIIIIFDSWRLRNSPGLAGALSIGWACVTCIIGISFFYFPILIQNIFVVLFWYFCGHIARMSYELRQQVDQEE
jgi:hypothetical protein